MFRIINWLWVGAVLLVSCRDEEAGVQPGPGEEAVVAVRGAWPEAPSSDLWEAAWRGDADAVREFLHEGADPDGRNEEGMTALMLAAEAGRREVAGVLAPRCIEGLDDALFLAACHDHALLVDLLARQGACVHARTVEGQTALMVAAARGADDTVRALLRHGANRYSTDAREHTAGQIAMMAGHVELGRMLLARPEPEEFDLAGAGEASDAVSVPPTSYLPNKISEQVARRSGLAGKGVTISAGSVEVAGYHSAMPGEELPSLPLVMLEFHQRWFPFKIGAVNGESVQLRFLYGSNDRITVREGDTIPKTRLKIVSVKSGADPADGAMVEVEDPRSGQRREIPVGREAAASAPYAVLEGEGGRMIAQAGKIVQTLSGHRYRVIEVRPTRVIFENANTGKLAAVTLGKR